jgi:hypothetical protein
MVTSRGYALFLRSNKNAIDGATRTLRDLVNMHRSTGIMDWTYGGTDYIEARAECDTRCAAFDNEEPTTTSRGYDLCLRNDSSTGYDLTVYVND